MNKVTHKQSTFHCEQWVHLIKIELLVRSLKVYKSTANLCCVHLAKCFLIPQITLLAYKENWLYLHFYWHYWMKYDPHHFWLQEIKKLHGEMPSQLVLSLRDETKDNSHDVSGKKVINVPIRKATTTVGGIFIRENC